MITLTHNEVDGFVEKLQRKGVDVRWDGWDIVFFTPKPDARRSVNGRWRGTWGFEKTVSPNSEGNWLLDYRLAHANAGRY